MPLLLDDQRLGTDDQDRAQRPARLELAQQQSRLDRLADADFVGDEKARAVGPDELQDRAELVGDEVDAAGLQRIEVGEARSGELQRREPCIQLVDRWRRSPPGAMSAGNSWLA